MMCCCALFKNQFNRGIVRQRKDTTITAYNNPAYVETECIEVNAKAGCTPVEETASKSLFAQCVETWIRWRGRRVGPIFNIDDYFDHEKRYGRH